MKRETKKRRNKEMSIGNIFIIMAVVIILLALIAVQFEPVDKGHVLDITIIDGELGLIFEVPIEEAKKAQLVGINQKTLDKIPEYNNLQGLRWKSYQRDRSALLIPFEYAIYNANFKREIYLEFLKK